MPIIIIRNRKATKKELDKMSYELGDYIKVVVDVEKEILTAGGVRHVQGKELLLQNGSMQENLWGGGFDLETNEVDFGSMINIRPNRNNPSREVLMPEVRKKIEEIVRKLLK